MDEEDDCEPLDEKEREELERLCESFMKKQREFLHAETDNLDGTINWEEVVRKDVLNIELDLSEQISTRHPCFVKFHNGETKRLMIHWLAITESELFFPELSPWAFQLNKQWKELLETRFKRKLS